MRSINNLPGITLGVNIDLRRNNYEETERCTYEINVETDSQFGSDTDFGVGIGACLGTSSRKQ